MTRLTLVPLLVTPADVQKPVRAAENIYAAAKQGQQFFEYQLGVTHDLAGVISIKLRETWPQIIARRAPAKSNGGNIWRDAFQEALDRRLLGSNPLSPAKGYYVIYLRPPTPEPWLDGFGGMIGLEDYRSDGIARPGMACMADEKTWLICGKTKAQLVAEGWPLPWFGSTVLNSIGAWTHEVVHIASDIPHNDDWNADTVTLEWWLGLKLGGEGVLTPAERTSLLATGMFG